MSNQKQHQHQQQQRQAQPRQSPEEDMNKKMAKSKDLGLHTKQEGTPDNEYGVGTGTVSTGGSSDGTGTV